MRQEQGIGGPEISRFESRHAGFHVCPRRIGSEQDKYKT